MKIYLNLKKTTTRNDRFPIISDFSLYVAYHFLFNKKKKVKAFIGDQTRDHLHGQHNFLGRLRIRIFVCLFV